MPGCCRTQRVLYCDVHKESTSTPVILCPKLNEIVWGHIDLFIITKLQKCIVYIHNSQGERTDTLARTKLLANSGRILLIVHSLNMIRRENTFAKF